MSGLFLANIVLSSLWTDLKHLNLPDDATNTIALEARRLAKRFMRDLTPEIKSRVLAKLLPKMRRRILSTQKKHNNIDPFV